MSLTRPRFKCVAPIPQLPIREIIARITKVVIPKSTLSNSVNEKHIRRLTERSVKHIGPIFTGIGEFRTGSELIFTLYMLGIAIGTK